MATDFLVPDVDDPETRPFWQGAAARHLLVQRCAACGLRRMPPRPMCPACQSLKVVWEPTSGRGTVWSFVAPHPPLLPAYAEVAPYNVVVVALDEDPKVRFVGNLFESAAEGANSVEPTSIRIGEPVRVIFREVAGVTLPQWVRA